MDMTNEMMVIVQTLDLAVLETAFAVLGGMIAYGIISALLRYLVPAIGYAFMYRKAGVAPWKAFIPLYNTYNNYKLSWNGKMFFLYAALSAASYFFIFAEDGIMGLISAAISIGVIFMIVKQNINMAKLFGKGVGTGIALILFPGITSLILGLGKAEFKAKEAAEAAVEEVVAEAVEEVAEEAVEVVAEETAEAVVEEAVEEAAEE